MLGDSTVLIVEDEADLREMYRHFIEGKVNTLREANDGKEAIEKWDEDVDVVVLDRRLPQKYGDEVLEEARERGLDAPVIMVTAVNPDRDITDMGFDDYFTKPIDRETLVEALKDMLERDRMKDEVREFLSVAEKMNVLQNNHAEHLLQTHGEYQELKHKYVQLAEDLKENKASLSEEERVEVVKAEKQVQAA
ncbi:response regulator transcription factor [Salinibaculum rarum]|uniref:response regulator transcription factor n=1 Tax=Salinibaculum rarum TaxID=3058903 RepID=UPI00265FCAB7|nr:response regulator [Salinibaculum sp. KK48]